MLPWLPCSLTSPMIRHNVLTVGENCAFYIKLTEFGFFFRKFSKYEL